ncbi:DUF1919 domain-containing protein [Thauera aminoaromatica]|uniref:DUF1919 domain-containing protein n=1 Tax=Thauera aminoaromatica TaxID=164330 RepID=A0A5C7SA24_THASP|nr:DUF1919 domain-containing protein [Thauera aminoaromatica]TXH80704.1 MAG: DUF1919 domain-containing protein [Thauera aminoaromatica]
MKLINSCSRRALKWRFSRKLRNSDRCYISQNCLGGRFYELEGRRYTSPTVGLWFRSSDFIEFCRNLDENLRAKISFDSAETERLGYPVGRLKEIRIYFQHYSSFDAAVAAWRKRAARVSLKNVLIVMTDRDGFSAEIASEFDKLNYPRKILFSHDPAAMGPNTIYIPGYEGDGCVGDLYGAYHKLNAASVWPQLFKILAS